MHNRSKGRIEVYINRAMHAFITQASAFSKPHDAHLSVLLHNLLHPCQYYFTLILNH
jgi:hypothetical protein